MTRRILLCTLGATPQIVTETVDALLYNSRRPWRPDIVEIVTTATGVRSITAGLFGPGRPWDSLFDELPPPISIYAPTRTGSGLPASALVWESGHLSAQVDSIMPDVGSTDDAERMADVIKDRIWYWVQQPDTSLHLSIAGGRKTMSAHALMALSLLGRPQDEASHVLIDDAFENHSLFWHRRQGGRLPTKRQLAVSAAGGDPGEPELDPARAQLSLMRVPVPLVAELGQTDRRSYGGLRFSTLAKHIEIAHRYSADPNLMLNDGANTVTIGEGTAKLPPVEYAKLRFLAEAVQAGWEEEARAVPESSTLLEADGFIFLPVSVLVGLTAGSNRVRDTWIPILARAQRAANIEEREGRGMGRGARKSPIQALRQLSQDTDSMIALLAEGEALNSPLTRNFIATAADAFASLTELRSALTNEFGVFLVNALLPKSSSSPKLARFRLNCPKHGIRIQQSIGR